MAKVKMNVAEPTEEVVKEVPVAKTKKEVKKAKVANCELLRLREEPSIESGVIDLLTKGTEVSILVVVDDEWSRVRSSLGKTGYVMRKYLA